MQKLFDVIIIGGGPAGLSAALILARCLRKIIVFDHGKPRNASSRHMHGFLSRDGENPAEMLRIAREQLKAYEVDIVDREIVAACLKDSFEVVDHKGNIYHSKKLLIATGLVDSLPEIEGFKELYGTCVFHCPYCDGYEQRAKPLAVLGYGKSGEGLALTLTNWSTDIVLCTNGDRMKKSQMDELYKRGIHVYNNKIARLEIENNSLAGIRFKNGDFLPRKAMFFTTSQYQRSHIADLMQCDFTRRGVVRTDNHQQTNVPGLYVAGDAARDMQMVMVAAAEGLRAGIIINKTLQEEAYGQKTVEPEVDHAKN